MSIKRYLSILGAVLLTLAVGGTAIVYVASNATVRRVRGQEALLERAIADLDLPNTDLLAGPTEGLSGGTIRWGWVLGHTNGLGETIDNVGSTVFQKNWWRPGNSVGKSALFGVAESAIGGCRRAAGLLDIGSGCGTGGTSDLLANVDFDASIQASILFVRFPAGSRGDDLVEVQLNGEFRRVVEARRREVGPLTVALVTVSCADPVEGSCEASESRTGPQPTPTSGR